MFMIPIYFQVTKDASPAVAGAYLIPAVVGNTTGGLLTGAWIKRTGRYKLPTILSTLSAMLAFTLVLLSWRGNTSVAESLFVFPGGLANGIAHSAVFIGLTSGVLEEEVAIAGSGLYLSGSIGAVAGVSGANAIFQFGLRKSLMEALRGRADRLKVSPLTVEQSPPSSQLLMCFQIIDKALSDIEYVRGVRGELREAMVRAYVFASHQVFSRFHSVEMAVEEDKLTMRSLGIDLCQRCTIGGGRHTREEVDWIESVVLIQFLIDHSCNERKGNVSATALFICQLLTLRMCCSNVECSFSSVLDSVTKILRGSCGQWSDMARLLKVLKFSNCVQSISRMICRRASGLLFISIRSTEEHSHVPYDCVYPDRMRNGQLLFDGPQMLRHGIIVSLRRRAEPLRFGQHR